ncbi:MnhB domain-containing protein [Bartonella clarridgeiae]|uniref:MnhB domain-containing protein n=1 Tax=Bartonella clarridgeiae TaxID=56426 RepID=UPI0012FF150B
MRESDFPEGGFAEGVILATRFILQYLATNIFWVESHLRFLIGFGLLFGGNRGRFLIF